MLDYERPPDSNLAVWVDTDIDTGDGLIEEICPEVFMLDEDGIDYPHMMGWVLGDGIDGIVVVDLEREDAVIEAAEEAAAENVFPQYVWVDDTGEICALWVQDPEIDDGVGKWVEWKPQRTPRETSLAKMIVEDSRLEGEYRNSHLSQAEAEQLLATSN